MILYLVFIFFQVNMRQDRLCCKKAQRDMDLFYVERNVRIFEKNISKIRRKWNTQILWQNSCTYYLQRKVSHFSQILSSIFFSTSPMSGIALLCHLVQFPLVQFTRSLEFLLIYIFFGLKEKFSMWYSELKNLESPLSFALRAV